MQITKELLDTELTTMQARLKEIEASANRIAGALIILQDLRKYIDQEEVVSAPVTDISPENAAIQARDEQLIQSVKVEDVQPDYDFEYDYQGAEEEGLDANG